MLPLLNVMSKYILEAMTSGRSCNSFLASSQMKHLKFYSIIIYSQFSPVL